MPGNTLFYACVHDNHNQRAIIAFASRYVADERWRAISSLSDVSPNTFGRISAQTYSYHATTYLHGSHSPGLVDFFHSQTYSSINDQFIGKLFITYENTNMHNYGGFTVIPEQEVADYLNGKLYYIRSKDDPRLFWNYPAGNAPGYNLSASTTTRTRFRVTAADTNLAKGTILVRSDKVIIQIANDLYVAVSEESGRLCGSDQPYEFLFGDLIGRKYDGAEESELEVSADGLGEAWELAYRNKSCKRIEGINLLFLR